MPSDREKKRMRGQATAKIERTMAASFAGGTRVRGSGARLESETQRIVAAEAPFGAVRLQSEGADIVADNFVIDDKRSEGERITFSRTIAAKIREAAAKHSKVPAVQFTFTRPITDPRYLDPRTWDQWVCIPKAVFDRMESAYFALGEDE